MKALVIGGDRHGEWIEGLPDGVRVWVDMQHGTSHVIRTLNNATTDIRTGRVTAAHQFRVAVHPDIVGPQEPMVVGQILQSIAMNEFAAKHGEEQEIPKEDSAAERLRKLGLVEGPG